MAGARGYASRRGRSEVINEQQDAASFIGNIPQHYDRGLGPIIFADYAADIARRVAALKPARVLETAAGTGSSRGPFATPCQAPSS